jgi:hypothetical protein
MLTVMTTLLCSGGAVAMWLFIRAYDSKQAEVLMHLLHFSSIVTAVMSLAMLPVVLKTRQEAPPPSITVLAVVVAALPILAAFF